MPNYVNVINYGILCKLEANAILAPGTTPKNADLNILTRLKLTLEILFNFFLSY